MAGRSASSLTPKIHDLVATDRHSRPPVGRLTASQLEQLVAIAHRRQRFDVPVSAARAIAALAGGAKPNVAVPALAAVLSNGKAPRSDRIAAARGLGTIASPEAERALLAHLRVRDPRVQQDVLAALGTFGGRGAAQALGKLGPPADPAARKQLAFARALIAHRNGLGGPYLSEARASERRPERPDEITALSLRIGTAKATAATLARLRGPTYGITFANLAYFLRCGPAEWTILVNKEIGRTAKSPTSLFDRPWIAAVLAQALPRREAVTTRLVMLTRSTGTQAHIDIARADGEIVYTGAAQQAGAAIAFAISDVERPGTAPLAITARITSTEVAVETAIASATRSGVREATAVVA